MPGEHPVVAPAPPPPRRLVVLVIGLAALSGLGMRWATTMPHRTGSAEPVARQTQDSPTEPLRVEVVHPQQGGLPRTIVQTGSVEAFETADIYPRVSGYLEQVAVELGDAVREGQLLATIDAPELGKDVERQRAVVKQAESRILQAEARLQTIRARRRAAEGVVAQAAAKAARSAAARSFRNKEYRRIQKLVESEAVESKLADEALHQLEAAQADEALARASSQIAEAELEGLDSEIEQAQADLAAAYSDLRVAEADLERAEVMLGYTRVVAPITGVVTQRNYDRGAFLHAASQGRGRPLLRVACDDRMRVVVRIPDPDVPFVDVGQQAMVTIDALRGRRFRGTISRISKHQDTRTRTMRAEIDLPNDDDLLASGMYGAVTIVAPASKRIPTLPADCLLGPPRNGRGKVYVLENGVVRSRKVGLGAGDGERVEILTGLIADEAVVLAPDGQADRLRNGCAAVVVEHVP